jgi:hypothetical protein
VLLGAIAAEYLLTLAEPPGMVSLRIVRTLLHPFAESSEGKLPAITIEQGHALGKARARKLRLRAGNPMGSILTHGVLLWRVDEGPFLTCTPVAAIRASMRFDG